MVIKPQVSLEAAQEIHPDHIQVNVLKENSYDRILFVRW